MNNRPMNSRNNTTRIPPPAFGPNAATPTNVPAVNNTVTNNRTANNRPANNTNVRPTNNNTNVRPANNANIRNVNNTIAANVNALNATAPGEQVPRGNLLNFFFTLMNQVKLYHWQTTSYSRHKATDKMLESLMEHIDRFIEVYQGRYGRIQVLENINDTTKVINKNDVEMEGYVKTCIQFLESDLVTQGYVRTSDTDLLNIRDEMIGDLHQLLYLFSLV
jgi:Family of unknown function (DUF5856)